MNTEIIATTTGPSSKFITLEDGLWNIFITSSNWGSANIQISHDGSTWFNAQENNADILFTTNSAKEINGGLFLRLNVVSHSANINLVAKKVI
jgi:predicted outer membrane repeat protein